MRAEVHIERLVLDGIAVTPGREHHLRQALARELAGLLEKGGLDRGLAGGGSLPRLAGGRVEAPADGLSSAALGRGIARAAYQGIGRGTPAKAGADSGGRE